MAKLLKKKDIYLDINYNTDETYQKRALYLIGQFDFDSLNEIKRFFKYLINKQFIEDEIEKIN